MRESVQAGSDPATSLIPAASHTRFPDWVVVGQEHWDEVERRNQLIVRALAERHPASRFLFSEIPRRPRDAREWAGPRLRRVSQNIWVLQPLRPLPDGVSRLVSDRIEIAQLQAAKRRIGIEQYALWTQDPRASDVVDLLAPDWFVYDLTDDWPAFEENPADRARVQERVQRLGGRADLVLACSRDLEAGARRWSSAVHHIPNAVDPLSDPAPVPGDLAALPRPILGYVGTMHDARLDVDLWLEMARLRPDWSFVHLGPDALGDTTRRALVGLPNFTELGTRPHGQVRSYIEGLDVCLVPHHVNSFTRSLDPLKIYEYLAAGRPIVATPTENTPALAAHVAVAASAEGFVAAAEEAIRTDDESLRARRRAAVASETWTARAQEIERLLADAGISQPAPVSEPAQGGPLVTIAIVNFDTRDLLQRCLRCVRDQHGIDTQVIVVDNASSDDSCAMVAEEFPEVELIRSAANLGFGPANNVGLQRTRGEYALLLNTDAFLPPGALATLIDTARAHPEAAVVGPRLTNPDGSLQRSAWPFPSARRLMLEALGLHIPLRRLGILEDLGTWDHGSERTVPFLIGACLLIRTDALRAAGGFDEQFWLYQEESDLLKRLADRGGDTLFTPSTSVEHVGSASSRDSAARLRSFYNGQKLYLRKHGGPLSWPAARLSLLIGSLLRRRWAAARVAITLRDSAGPHG